jgi:hypothetical protein
MERLQAVLDQHPTGTIHVAWDNASAHADDEVETVVRAAADRLVLLYLPMYSPWLNPIEMIGRHVQREVTHGELFEPMAALVTAATISSGVIIKPLQGLSLIGADST